MSELPAEPVEVVADGAGHWVLPDLSGRSMRAALSALQGAGLDLSVEGSGRVVDQEPSAGTPLAPGDAVHLVLN